MENKNVDIISHPTGRIVGKEMNIKLILIKFWKLQKKQEQFWKLILPPGWI